MDFTVPADHKVKLKESEKKNKYLDLARKLKKKKGRINTTIWMHHMDANSAYGEKAWRQLYKNAASGMEEVLEVTPYKTADVRPPTTHHENHPH